MEYKKNSFLITIVDDEVVVGEITRWSWFSLRIVSASPYLGWENHMSLTSYGSWMYYGDLRAEKGVKWATWALGDSYKRANWIYSNIDRFTKMYLEYKQQVKELDNISNSSIRERIKQYLEDHLFESQIFSLPFTDLKDSRIYRGKILGILDASLVNCSNQ